MPKPEIVSQTTPAVEEEPPVVPNVRSEQTSSGLRKTLFEEMDDLRNGNSTPARASAVAKLAAQVISSVRMELDLMNSNPEKPPVLLKAFPLTD